MINMINKVIISLDDGFGTIKSTEKIYKIYKIFGH